MAIRSTGARRAPRAATAALALLALAACPQAFARTCKVAVASNDQMQFDKPEIRVAKDCTKVQLTLTHTGQMPAEVMGHNWVLATTANLKPVAEAGMAAGAAAGYVPKGDARVLAKTAVIGGGGNTSVTFSTSALKAGGDYTFFCSFPGHWAIMKGKFVFG